jgi:tetratricopeptide (TPR) repeat protein
MDRGWKFVRARQTEEACDLFAQAVAEARFLERPVLLVEALMALGQTECGLRHSATAVDCFREAATVAEHHTEPALQAEALIEIAEILVQQQRNAEAAAVCDQLLAVVQKAENDAARARARALHLLARIQEKSAEQDELVLLWQAAAALYEVADENQMAAECKSNLAFLLGQ